MMANKMTTRQKLTTSAKATLPRKRYRFLFDLESGVAIGSEYECEALNERDAMNTLEQLIPGIGIHVKSVRILH